MLVKEKPVKNKSFNDLESLEKKPLLSPNLRKLLIISLLIAFLGFLMMRTFEEVVIQKSDGSYELSPKQVKALQKDTAKFLVAEQYVLIAKFDNWYPCLTCPNSDSIFLFKGEVIKYGVTINGQKVRYSGKESLLERNIEYIPQFVGSIERCLILERIQIRSYPLLPENLKRIVKLAQPPLNPINK